MDSFFKSNLAAQTDVGKGRWVFRRDASSGVSSASGSSGSRDGGARLLGSFQNAEAIRSVYFAGNAPSPSLEVELTPLDVDAGILQYTLDVDGQTLRYAHGPPIPTRIRWPGARGTNLVALQIATSRGTDTLQTQGPWALHRLLDKARITPGGAPESMIASFDFNGQKLALRVTASSSDNPFQLAQMSAFSCP